MTATRLSSSTADLRLGAPGQILSLVLLAAVFAAVSYAAIFWTSFGGATAIWPTNALALVAILRGPRGWFWRIGVLAALGAAMVAVMVFAGSNLLGALLVAGPNLLEVLVATLLLSAFRLAGTDVTRPAALLAFLACAAVAAPAVAAVAAAPVIAMGTGSSLVEAAWLSWVTDALSMMIIVPFGVVMTGRRLAVWRSRADALIALALFVAISAAVWLLVPLEPAVIAVIAPLTVLATLRFGAVGAATAVLWRVSSSAQAPGRSAISSIVSSARPMILPSRLLRSWQASAASRPVSARRRASTRPSSGPGGGVEVPIPRTRPRPAAGAGRPRRPDRSSGTAWP